VIVYVQPLNWCTRHHLQKVMIPEAAHIKLQRGPPEDEQG